MKNQESEKRDDGLLGKRDKTEGRRPFSSLSWIILLVVLLVWVFTSFFSGGDLHEISYSTFREQLLAGNVSSVVVAENEIQGDLIESLPIEEGEGETTTYDQFVTYLPSFGDDSLLSLLEAENVTIETEPPGDSTMWAIVLNILPFLLFLGIGFLIFRQMRSQLGGRLSLMGQSRAKLYEQKQERTTFDDVAGLTGVKVELQEIIDYLMNPMQVVRLGGNAPKGVLLVGPPGTGKTLLARAVAGEANVPFFSITGSDFMEMFVGVGASRVRGMFDDARKAAPCIVFIDELDSIGRRRGAGLGGGHDEREQTLNQLLSELDGFEPAENVIVMAATNRPDILDPALLRPGRFDRRITVDLPVRSAREDILKIHAKNKPLASDVDLGEIAQGTPGFSGADLENLLNEAALIAARKEKDEIELADIEEARDKVLLGLVREGLALSKQEKEVVSYHEAGHALIAALLPNSDPIHKVTIVPRGRAMGVTQQLPKEEKYIYFDQYLRDRLAVLMGGRAAERLVFDASTSGAENDLQQATQLARKMVLSWGMSERFGHLSLGSEAEQVFLGEDLVHRREYSEATAVEADQAISDILNDAYRRALEMLRGHRDELDRIAEQLIAQEEMSSAEVQSILDQELATPVADTA